MKKALFNLIAVFLMLAGGSLLVIGLMDGQGLRMLLGAGLALLAGLVALLMQNGFFSQRVGTMLGILFAAIALYLAYLNYHDRRPVEPAAHPSSHLAPDHAH